jgi:NAD(P)H-hydrate epimerase
MDAMLILTAEEMRRVDERAEREHGVPSETLMDNAGREVASAVVRIHPELPSRRVLILCGKGNNGGDGITAARHLRSMGVTARVALLAAGDDLNGAAAWALRKARAEEVSIEEVVDEAAWRSLRRVLPEYDLIVDAILGTGTRGAARGRSLEAIEAINAAGTGVISVDIPSGLSGSSPEIPGPCVEADATLALAALKIPHVFAPAAELSGRVEVLEIGIPAAALEAENGHLHWADADLVGAMIPSRRADAHKGDFGHVLILAGSLGKSGAAVLMARACLRSGAGLVTVASPATAQPLVATGMPEAMTEPLPETAEGMLARSALPRIRELLETRDVLAVGPGIGTDPETAALVEELVAWNRKPAILDADALNILAAGRKKVKEIGAHAVITPHPGEAARMLGIASRDVQQDRLGAARRLAAEWNTCALLKGHRTLLADPSGEVRVNPTGNAGMATGGAGDVLSGMVAAWLAQGLTPFAAATVAAHAHGLAGDLAVADRGAVSLIAGDIIEALPRAYSSLTAARQSPA